MFFSVLLHLDKSFASFHSNSMCEYGKCYANGMQAKQMVRMDMKAHRKEFSKSCCFFRLYYFMSFDHWKKCKYLS